MIYTVRPISDHTWIRAEHQREYTRFDSTWTKTQQLLSREIDLLKGRDVVFEIDVREQDIKMDGMLRANARAESPAVVVAFESKHGPQLYRCDQYVARWSNQGPSWQQNVRAIALTLEALRDMERWGAVETGQQYTGFKQLGAGTALSASHMTSDRATEILRQYGEDPTDSLLSCYRIAQRKTHPDRNGGDHSRWHEMEEAAKVLRLL